MAQVITLDGLKFGSVRFRREKTYKAPLACIEDVCGSIPVTQQKRFEACVRNCTKRSRRASYKGRKHRRGRRG